MGISRGTWPAPRSRTGPVHKVLNRLFLRGSVAGNTSPFFSAGPSNATIVTPRPHHPLNYSPAPFPKSAPSSPPPHQRLITRTGRSHYTTIHTPHYARLLRLRAHTTTNCLAPSPISASSFFSASLPPIHVPVMSMASYPFSSASSSDISTPRSHSPSPSSVISARSSRSSISNKRMSISSRRMTDFNPMSAVDISAIEEKMRMAALDQHRGYAQNTFGEVQQYRTTEYVPKNQATAYQVLTEPLWNKGELIAANSTYTTQNLLHALASPTQHVVSLPLHLSVHISLPPFFPTSSSST
ncbi:putative malic enzyme [Colletotrichum sublineola]|uniref:Putative malic enzyme n=1 Tax=Colletotrichum sublineola TaxID=1173701 RepID=A0A066XGB6_COLSU|nr:putative malic enzyme [Colletotrichum sublineola]